MEWEFIYKMGIVGEEVIGKEMGMSPPNNHIDIFYGGWLSSPPSQVYIYIYNICTDFSI